MGCDMHRKLMMGLLSGLPFLAQGATLDISSMSVTGGAMYGPEPWMATTLIYVGPETNLVGAYIGSGGEGFDEHSFSPDSILVFDFSGYTASFYTAPSNLGDVNSVAGIIGGGSVPSGTIDTVAGTLTLDISSLFVNQMNTDINVAPAGNALATGSWNAQTQAYHLNWDGYFPGPGFGAYWQFEFTGFATPVPEPSAPALWLTGLGIFVLARSTKRGRGIRLIA